MRRNSTIAIIVLVVAAMAAIPIAAMAAPADPVAADDGNETAVNDTADENATIAPGQRLSGVVGIQQAELEGDIDSRAFGLRIANAASDNASAAVVAEQVGDLEQRLERLQERKQELRHARENGSMSHGEYAAEISRMAARIENTRQLANQSEQVAMGLPAERLEEHGINATRIRMVAQHAEQLHGPEVAEMARGIAGPGAAPGHGGPHMGGSEMGGPGMGGPDEMPRNGTSGTESGQNTSERGSGQHGPGGPGDGSGGMTTATATPDGEETTTSGTGGN